MKLTRITDHREVANTRTAVQEYRRDASAAAAYYGEVSRAGSALEELGARLRTAEIESELASAQLQAADRLDKVYRELEQDSEIDPDEVETRYREQAEAILAEEGGRISAPAFQRAWRAQAEAISVEGTIQARTLGHKKRTDRVRANVLDVGAKYKTQAEDLSVSPEMMERSAQTYMQLIERQRRSGVFSEEQATAFKIEAEETLRAGKSLRHMANIDALADQGRWGEAEEYMLQNYGEIDSASREQVKDVIRARTLEAEVIQGADNIWNASGRDYDEAIAKMAEIEDPARRKAMEARIAQLDAQDKNAEAARQQDAHDEGLTVLINGGSYASISPSLLSEMGAQNAYRLQEIDRRRQEEAAKSAEMNAATKAQLKALSQMNEGFINTRRAENPELYLMGPSVWANEAPELAEAFENMRGEDQIAMMEDIAQRRTGGLETDAIDKIMAELIPAIEFYGPSDVGGDFKKGSKKNGFSATEKAVRKELYALAREHSRKTGGELPTAEEARRMVAQAFILSDKASTQYLEQFGGNPYAALMSGYDQGFDMRRRAEAESLARTKLGRVPTQQEIQQVYDLLGPSE